MYTANVYTDSDLKFTGKWFIDQKGKMWLEADVSYKEQVRPARYDYVRTGKWYKPWTRKLQYREIHPAQYKVIEGYEYISETHIVDGRLKAVLQSQ